MKAGGVDFDEIQELATCVTQADRELDYMLHMHAAIRRVISPS